MSASDVELGTTVVRAATVPISELDVLLVDAPGRLASELDVLEARLADDAERVSSALFQAVGRVSDRRLRNELLELRRAAHGSRWGRAARLLESLREKLPADVAALVSDLIELGRSLESFQDAAEAAFAEEESRARRRLAAILRTAPVLSGIAIASRELSEDAGKWLADASRSAPARNLELGLASYLARAAAKTSPYSTFTVQGRVLWAESGPPLQLGDCGAARSGVELHRAVEDAIFATVCSWPELRAELLVRRNPSLRRDGGSATYVTWSRSEGEKLRRARGAALDVVELLAEKTTWRAAECELAGAGVSGKPLEALLAGGLIEVDLPGSVGLSHRLLPLLERAGSERCLALASSLRALQADLAALAAEPAAGRRTGILERLSAGAVRARAAAGADRSSAAKNLVYENRVLPPAETVCSRGAWQPVIDDLARVRGLVALFDPGLRTRLQAADLAAVRCGAGARMPALELYAMMRQEPSLDDSARDPLLGARERVIDSIAESRLRAGPRAVEIDLDGEMVAGAAAALPCWAHPRSTVFYCQPLVAGGRLEAVVNNVHSGCGRLGGRLAWLESLAGWDAGPATTVGCGGSLVLDVGGPFGNNAGLHADVAPLRLEYPGAGFSSVCGGVEAADLDVEHDAESGRLRLLSRRLGAELLPANLGMLSEQWLPPFIRWLLELFGDLATHPALRWRLALTPSAMAGGGIASHPRLRFGRLTLARRAWTVPNADRPRLEQRSRLARLTELERWRRRAQLPERCFVRAADVVRVTEMSRIVGFEMALRMSKNRKPMYLDFRSYLAADLLERVGQGASALLFEEALPDREHLPAVSASETVVTEVAIELAASEEA